MSSFAPDDASVSGRLEIARNLRIMRQKIMRAGPSLRTQEPAGKNSRPSSARHASRVPAGPAPSRPGSARKGKSSQRTTFSSPPKTFELAEQLSENRRKARAADYAVQTHQRNLSKLFSKIQNMKSELRPREGDLDNGARRRKKTKPRIYIDWKSGEVFSAPTSPFATSRGKASRRPQSAPPQKHRIRPSSAASGSKKERQVAAYKDAIKDYIVDNSIYEEQRLHELFDNYKKEKQKDNEDIVLRAIEELKIELKVG